MADATIPGTVDHADARAERAEARIAELEAILKFAVEDRGIYDWRGRARIVLGLPDRSKFEWQSISPRAKF
jgi:hypothetical protein